MKSAPFVYHRPTTIGAASALLAELGDEAKVLAGGQSLVPLMALRLGRPAHLVDISRCTDHVGIDVDRAGRVTVGAMVTHATAERSAVVAQRAPLVAQAVPLIAHRAIRSRGTVVGSIAHGDPAAEMPAVCLATDATMIAVSTRGEREIGAADFFRGYLSTALASDEILVAVRFPAWGDDETGTVVEVARRHGDYALVGLAARFRLDGAVVRDAALAFFGVGSTALRVPDAEAGLLGATFDDDDVVDSTRATVVESLRPPADIHASQTYRRHLAGVLTARAMRAASNGDGR